MFADAQWECLWVDILENCYINHQVYCITLRIVFTFCVTLAYMNILHTYIQLVMPVLTHSECSLTRAGLVVWKLAGDLPIKVSTLIINSQGNSMMQNINYKVLEEWVPKLGFRDWICCKVCWYYWYKCAKCSQYIHRNLSDLSWFQRWPIKNVFLRKAVHQREYIGPSWSPSTRRTCGITWFIYVAGHINSVLITSVIARYSLLQISPWNTGNKSNLWQQKHLIISL